jgi:16S rRNA (guanine527-N7)-methyltransferase
MVSKTDAENFLSQGLQLMGLVPDNKSEAIIRLSLYFQELKKWNRKVNLVARSLSDRQILEDHFLDSLTLLLLLQPNRTDRETLLDIGTGGGFPGLVLKAACPQLDLTLIESRKNRYYFLKHIIRTLDLTGVKVYNIFLTEQNVSTGLSGCYFSFITSRAFAHISRLIECGAPYLAKNGRIVAMKGPGVEAELQKLKQSGKKERFRVMEKMRVLLPFSEKERWLISFSR